MRVRYAELPAHHTFFGRDLQPVYKRDERRDQRQRQNVAEIPAPSAQYEQEPQVHRVAAEPVYAADHELSGLCGNSRINGSTGLAERHHAHRRDRNACDRYTKPKQHGTGKR